MDPVDQIRRLIDDGEPDVLTKIAAVLGFDEGYEARIRAEGASQATKGDEHPPLADGMVNVPCALQIDQTHPQYGWLFIPHVDGNWVTAAKLYPFSLKIIEHWRAAVGNRLPINGNHAGPIETGGQND